jgi:hypothetical protein
VVRKGKFDGSDEGRRRCTLVVFWCRLSR